MATMPINPGDTFESFKIIERDKTRVGGAAYWICQCKNCKKIKSMRADAIRKNPKCSCARSANLIGHTINGFKVLSITEERSSDKSIILLCQCQKCGTIQKNPSNVLRQNRKSCEGCGKRTTLIDLTGKRFGHLVVLNRDTTKMYGHDGDPYWICRCDCGTIKSIRGFSLSHGMTTSCGCVKSRGEEKISNLLVTNNIFFKKEYTFPDLIYKKPLRFDFAVFDKNNLLSHLVEYDGIQHFDKNNSYYSQENVLRDQMKNQYCLDNNIPLIRIKYNEEITLNKILGEKDVKQFARASIKDNS